MFLTERSGTIVSIIIPLGIEKPKPNKNVWGIKLENKKPVTKQTYSY